jgi:hypothetical protein
MITAITLENFKGVREPVTLRFRPITLLFGANSAGKSSFFHSLHYAHELFEHHNADADHTATGGPYVDLGGFESLVHGRDRNAAVRIKLDVRMDGLPWYGFGANYDAIGSAVGADIRSFLRDPIVEASVDLTIRWSHYEQRPYVASNTISLNGTPFAEITCESNIDRRSLRILNANLPEFWVMSEFGEEQELFGKETVFHRSGLLFESYPNVGLGYTELPLAQARRRGDALPDLDVPLEFLHQEPPESVIAGSGRLMTDDEQRDTDILAFGQQFMAAVSELVLAPCEAVRHSLRHMRYLGPVRESPSRHHRAHHRSDPRRWASGLGAWDVLATASEEFVSGVSKWMGDQDRLGTGYEVGILECFEIPVSDPLVVKLRSGRLIDDEGYSADSPASDPLASKTTHRQLYIVPKGTDLALRPQDVGTGIAQLLPVVVTILDGNSRLLCIEQPELHVHPRVQAAIADLLIEGFRNHGHLVVAETHSECLVIRLLRRIRESVGRVSANSDAKTRRQPNKPVATKLSPSDVAIYFISSSNGAVQCREIEVDDAGEFIQDWPDDFFEVDFKERYG